MIAVFYFTCTGPGRRVLLADFEVQQVICRSKEFIYL